MFCGGGFREINSGEINFGYFFWIILFTIILNSFYLYDRYRVRKLGVWEKITGVTSVLMLLLMLLGIAPTFSVAFINLLSQNFTLVLVLTFLTLILWFMLKVYNSIRRQVYRHLSVRYFGRNNTPQRPSGPRIVINIRSKRAYWVDDQLENLVKKKIIEWYSHPCEEMEDWVKRNGIELIEERPLQRELLMGSESRFASLYRRFYEV